nr:hypothetical protein [uncultured Mediterraneibacter sp.]
MEIKIGEKTVTVPPLVATVAVITVGTIVADICNVRISNHDHK